VKRMIDQCGFGVEKENKSKKNCKGCAQFMDMSVYSEGCEW